MDPHAERVERMFSSIAGRYDRLNRILSLGLDGSWRRAAARRAELGPGGRALDACGGTGELALELLGRFPGSEVAVLDFSGAMLGLAGRKGAAAGEGFQRVLGDALRCPFGGGVFDAVGCAFGLRNLSDLEAGLGEFHRVLRPGGRLCILEFTAEEGSAAGRLARWYVRRVVPVVGGMLAGAPEAYGYLARSVAGFASRRELEAHLARAGFEEVESRLLSFGACALVTAVRPAEGEGFSPRRTGSRRDPGRGRE